MTDPITKTNWLRAHDRHPFLMMMMTMVMTMVVVMMMMMMMVMNDYDDDGGNGDDVNHNVDAVLREARKHPEGLALLQFCGEG